MLVKPEARKRKRLDIPHEPGQWIEVQRLAWSEMPSFQLRVSDLHGYIAAAFKSAVVAWSYPEPVTPEHLACLDDTTAGWLYVELDKFQHHADDDQGNAIAPSIAS